MLKAEFFYPKWKLHSCLDGTVAALRSLKASYIYLAEDLHVPF